MNKIENCLWVEKYRPIDIESIILPLRIKQTFHELITKKEIPNLLLTGSAGCGKSTLAKVFCNVLGIDYLFINASMNTGIDVVRSKIQEFVVTMSLNSKLQKVIILDEGDNISKSAMDALRGFIEQYTNVVRFIFTANNESKISLPIHSRVMKIDFTLNDEEKRLLMKEFAKRLLDILKKENIEITDAGKKCLGELIKKLFPDMRKILNEVQKYTFANNKVDEGILFLIDDTKYKELQKYMKEKNFDKFRSWLSNNVGENTEVLYDYLFKNMYDFFVKKSIPEAVLILSEYSSRYGFSKELHAAACITQLAGSCEIL